MGIIQSFRQVFTTLFFHDNPVIRGFLTLGFCGIALFYNFYLVQAFCIPVWWAATLCTCFIISLVLYPFVSKRLKPLLALFIGTGVPICLYCILFLSNPLGYFLIVLFYLLSIFFFGFGLPVLFPFYLLWHIYKYAKLSEHREKICFTAGAALPVLCFAIYLFPFKKNFDIITDAYATDSSRAYFLSHIPVNYFSERVLGTGFKYHTRLCYDDGWRPPLHDPFYNTALLLFSDTYYPLHSLNDRISCYRQLFPNKPVKVKCSCSKAYITRGHDYLEGGWDRYVP